MDVAAFPDRLAEAVERKRSQLVVGLDPRLDVLPVELRAEAVLGRSAAASSVARFCKGIVDAVGPYVVAVKPQAAFFEALGSDGMRALEEVCAYARSIGLLVILDAKRGDVGSTSRAYVAAYLEPNEDGVPLADAMTASPYLGLDSVEPFLAACRRHGSGVFFLVRTSNAGAADVQDAAALRRPAAVAAPGDARPRMGAATRRRRWHVERRRRRRRHLATRCLGGPPLAAPDAASAPRGRRAGRDTGRRRPRVHERAGERARDCVALCHLRVPRHGGGLAGRGGAAAAERLSSQVWAASGW